MKVILSLNTKGSQCSLFVQHLQEDSDLEPRYFWYTWGGVKCIAREYPSIPLTKRGHMAWWESLHFGVRGPGFKFVSPPARCVTFSKLFISVSTVSPALT